MKPAEALAKAVAKTFEDEEELFARRMASSLDRAALAGATLRINVVRQLQVNLLRNCERSARWLERDAQMVVVDVEYEEMS